ncbi:MAG: GTPase ObgE [Coprobacillus sp.]|nr:GTPase ObgE [Coprobacillus sp.]
MMTFIDRVVIEVRSGKGGDGMISFHREKYVSHGGPSGGNGGRGASIYFTASKKINTLYNFRHSKAFIAEDGEKGGTENCFGRKGEDLYIEVPVGTVVYLEDGHEFLFDLSEDGQTVMVAKGGRGGRGNAAFKSSVNKTPKVAENGAPGESKRLILELKLLADVGFIGLPSVGKSTLLAAISAARPEIADYPFTTLVPNLGVVALGDESFVAADLPGLIKGAHQGKGLGLQFLRHIERCRVIVHIIDMSDNGRDPYQDYKEIMGELEAYGFGLLKRPMIIVASKMDEEGAKEKLTYFKKKVKKDVIEISALTDMGLDTLIRKCLDTLKVTPLFPLYDEDNDEEQMKVYTLGEEEKEFEINRSKEHEFTISGERIERYYKMCNLSTDEGMMKLISHLRRVGVDDALEKLGAKTGDEVILCDFVFEYVE